MSTGFEPVVSYSMWNQCNLVYVLTRDFYAFYLCIQFYSCKYFLFPLNPKAVSIFFLLKKWGLEF